MTMDKETELIGWIARNKEPDELIFCPGEEPPIRMACYWLCGFTWSYCQIPNICPDITWESEPVKVKLKVERI